MRVLVTGGTGYLGRAIVAALTRHGHAATVFARQATGSGLPGRLVDGDVRDIRALRDAADSVDAICHTAALVSVWRPRREEFDEVNVGGLRHVIDVCRTLRIRNIVYTSSFLALPPADNPVALAANDYQRTKLAALAVARHAAQEGIPIIVLYPGVIYGPGPVTEGNLIGRMIRDHLRGRLPGLIGADRRWSYAYIDDVAEAHVAALAHSEPDEYVVGGENASQTRLFEIVRAISGRALPRSIPFPVADAIGRLEELRGRLFRRPPLLTRGIVEIFRHDWSLESSRAIVDLSFRITPLIDGLSRTIAAMR